MSMPPCSTCEGIIVSKNFSMSHRTASECRPEYAAISAAQVLCAAEWRADLPGVAKSQFSADSTDQIFTGPEVVILQIRYRKGVLAMHAHGIMFHHFHDETANLKRQGSISAADLELIITTLRANFNILDAKEYSKRTSTGTLQSNDLTLTFDDALKCQHDIAAPILKKYNIRAFFFVYSSVFGDNPDPLEYYRDFRNSYFNNIDSFYESFFMHFNDKHPNLSKDYKQNYPKDYLSEFPFYTDNDRHFRFVRDKILGPEPYSSILEIMMQSAGYSKAERRKTLFLEKKDLISLSSEGHSIGLHSHTHPTQIHLLDEITQRREYEENHRFIQETIGIKPDCMSHPNGNYDSTTLSILNHLGISIGFRSSMNPSVGMSNLEIPREDHANVIKLITQTGGYLR